MSANALRFPAPVLFTSDWTEGKEHESFSTIAVEATTVQYTNRGRVDVRVNIATHGDAGEFIRLDVAFGRNEQVQVFDGLNPAAVVALARALGMAIARGERIGMVPVAADTDAKRAKRQA